MSPGGSIGRVLWVLNAYYPDQVSWGRPRQTVNYISFYTHLPAVTVTRYTPHTSFNFTAIKFSHSNGLTHYTLSPKPSVLLSPALKTPVPKAPLPKNKYT